MDKQSWWDYARSIFGPFGKGTVIVLTILAIIQTVGLYVEGPWSGRNWPVHIPLAWFIAAIFAALALSVVTGGWRRDTQRLAEIAELKTKLNPINIGSLRLKIWTDARSLLIAAIPEGAKAINVETILRQLDETPRPFKVWPWGVDLVDGEESKVFGPVAELEPHPLAGDLIVNTVVAPGVPRFSRDRTDLGEFEVVAEAVMGGQPIKASRRFRLSNKEGILGCSNCDV